MKKFLFTSRIIVFLFFILALLATILQLTGKKNPLAVYDEKAAVKDRNEQFDPRLLRLNSVDKLTYYCDSVYHSQFGSTHNPDFERNYSQLVANVIRNRFFHGYSYYGFENNYLAVLFSRLTKNGYSAIIPPNDILKYPNAACSQQSIVMMEVLQQKGFQTRKIGFSGKSTGHFCLEVFYGGDWHFYDTNLEPNEELLNSYDRPSVASLVANKDLLKKAYAAYTDFDIIDLFSSYSYGPVNKFPGLTGMIFQKTTRFLSYTLWVFLFLLFIIIHRLYRRRNVTVTNVRNRRVYFPQSEQRTSPSYYPGIEAPGS